MLLKRLRAPAKRAPRMPLLKKLFWVYFLLLIFEGALRKWILPQLSGPLLIVRDPIAILIIWEAYRTHKWPKRWSSVVGILAAGMLTLCIIQFVAGENPWFVAVYGLRSYLLPFPVAFIMGENLDAEDLRKFGTWTLLLLLPLTVLEVAQYYGGPSSVLNAGVREGMEQIGYVTGHVRASATFSYVAGPMGFVPLAAGFIFYGLAKPGFAKKWLLWTASFALILSVPVIGSRTVVFELAAVVACVGIAAMSGVSQFTKSLQMIATMLVMAFLVTRLPIFAEANQSMLQRFTEASGEEGNAQESFLLRVVQPMTNMVESGYSGNNWLGLGVGYGANAIATLLIGEQIQRAGEQEVVRVINEFGWPCGIAFMLFRVILELMLISKAISRLREGDPLAWLLVPLTTYTLIVGVLEQPTEQGFMVMSVAFTLAALKRTETLAVPASMINLRRRPAPFRQRA